MHELCAPEEREGREIVGRWAEEGGRTSPHLPTRPSLDLPPKSTLDLAALQAKLKTLQARSTSPNPKPDPGPALTLTLTLALTLALTLNLTLTLTLSLTLPRTLPLTLPLTLPRPARRAPATPSAAATLQRS